MNFIYHWILVTLLIFIVYIFNVNNFLFGVVDFQRKMKTIFFRCNKFTSGVFKNRMATLRSYIKKKKRKRNKNLPDGRKRNKNEEGSRVFLFLFHKIIFYFRDKDNRVISWKYFLSPAVPKPGRHYYTSPILFKLCNYFSRIQFFLTWPIKTC